MAKRKTNVVDIVEQDSKKKYVQIEPIIKAKCQWNFIFGGRSNGKSFCVKYEELKNAYNPDGPSENLLCYVRMYDTQIKNDLVYDYFSDMITTSDGRHPIEEITKGKYNSLRVARNKIWLINEDEEGKDLESPYKIGIMKALNIQKSTKSSSLLNVNCMILEEFMDEDNPQMCKYFVSLVSTIARSRFIRVWCIGNNEVRDNAWFDYFGLKEAYRQKQGTMHVYEFKNDNYDEDGNPIIIRVSCTYCFDNASNGMFYGKAAEQNKGGFKAKDLPLMSLEELEDYTLIYEVYFKYRVNGWHASLYMDERTGGMFWFIIEHNGRIPLNTRVISDKMSIDPMHTMNMIPLNDFENKAFELLRNGKIYYFNNLMGTEFQRAWLYFNSYNVGFEE